jgi:hypothetical protein
MRYRLLVKIKVVVKRWIDILVCDSHSYFAETSQAQQKRIEQLEAMQDRCKCTREDHKFHRTSFYSKQ